MKTPMTVALFSLLLVTATAFGKPNAQEALQTLADGNARFVSGGTTHPRGDMTRATLAAKSDQADYALATIISCSDSRVPPEILFDTGIMDIFIIRVAGNVCSGDEIGSAEYGVFHAKTPLLIVMGHSKCGAVTAVVKATKGEGHALEKNIPALVAPVGPAVQKVLQAFPQATTENLIVRSTEANVWQGIENIFLRSAALREQASAGKVKVLGAIYDLESGKVRFLSDEKCAEVLKQAEANPARETQKMAEGGGHHAETKEAAKPAKAAPAHEAEEKAPAAHAEPAAAPAHH